jgi:hypothetical protein
MEGVQNIQVIVTSYKTLREIRQNYPERTSISLLLQQKSWLVTSSSYGKAFRPWSTDWIFSLEYCAMYYW